MTDLLPTVALVLLLFAAGGVGLYFLARWMLEQAADRAVRQVEGAIVKLSRDERLVAVGRAARSAIHGVGGERLNGWGRYAAAEGVTPRQAQEQFQGRIARIATLMDSAVEVPILGRVGLDAVLGLFPSLAMPRLRPCP